jgi:hypothetical protein
MQGRDLTGERAARKAYHNLAHKRLDWIDEQKQRHLRYQPDRQLFAEYEELVAYDDRDWLVQSGPLYPPEQKAAEQEAWRRATRTARTVTDLSEAGFCSFKDRMYLKGYLDVSHFLEHGGELEQLYVGKMGVDQVEDMQELHILRPTLQHFRVAADPELEKRITEFEKE